jgi:hypothetical protein
MNKAFLRRQTASKWKDLQCGIWERWDYKCCYLTIRQTDEGKFIPAVNGSNDLRKTHALDSKPILCESLEEAKKTIYEYIDWVKSEGEKKRELIRN